MINNQNKRILGIILIIASVPGLGYALIVSLGGGVFFFIAMIGLWLYWVPSLAVLLVGLNLYWKSKNIL